MEIDLKKVLSVLFSKLWLIITVTMLSGAIFLVASLFFVTPMYTSNALLYISNASERKTSAVSANDVIVSRDLVDTFVVILSSHTVLDKVIEQSGLDYSYAEVKDMISASSVSSTEVFRLSVTNPDPTEAQILCDSILNVAPGEIKRIMNAGAISIVDYATLPLAPSSPDIMKNTVLGAFLGALIASFLIVVLNTLDSRVKSEFDLVENFELPIIGSIPSFKLAEKPTPEAPRRRITAGRRSR